MTGEIKSCKAEINALLEKNSPETDWENVCAELLVKIKFFQHERLVHLIVTMFVSLMTVICVCFAFFAASVSVQFLMLIGLLLILTAAYLIHYFKLENAVQGIYFCYYKAREKCRK